MRYFWSDPFLWVHLAGLAALPIFLELCLLGFSVGSPLLPVWLELLLVAGFGIAPVLWMQLSRPFYIFSILAVAMKPEQLTPDRRRTLSLFKTPAHRALAVVAAALLALALWPLYRWAPIAAAVAPFPPEWHLAGLLLAALAFLGCNLFLQVPVSVALVMARSEAKFAATEPLPLEKIRQYYTIIGLQVKQILPALAFGSPQGDKPASGT